MLSSTPFPAPCLRHIPTYLGNKKQPASIMSENNDYLHGWKLAIVVFSLCLGVVLYGLDVNIVGVAIPTITTEFHSLDDMAWYGSAYLMAMTAFQPFFGNMYKYFHAKTVYVVSIIIFGGKCPIMISCLMLTKTSWVNY